MLTRSTHPSRPGLRVAHLTSDHAALDSRIFYKECRSLARAGYQVFLLGPHAKDAEIDGVRIKAIRPPRTRWSRLSITLGQLWREAVRVDAEVYHLHDPELLPLGLWLRRRGKAVIYDVHDDFPALASIGQPRNGHCCTFISAFRKQTSHSY